MLTTPQTVPQSFPKEITDIIISFVHTGYLDGYKPLCNCALVCRDWLPASRHYLLMDVWLRSDQQYNLSVSNVVRSPSVSPWLPSTRRITLSPSFPGKTSADGRAMCIAPRLFMRELSGRFPNLEELELINVNWDTRESSIPPRMFILLSAFASVRTLLLANIRFPSSGTMRCTITALPSLTDLRMDNIKWPISRSVRQLRSTRKSQLLGKVRRFQLYGLDSALEEEMIEWFPFTSLGTSLVALQIESTMLIKGSALWEHAGSSITQLATNFGEEGGEP